MIRITASVLAVLAVIAVSLAAQNRAPAQETPPGAQAQAAPPQFRFAYALDSDGKIRQVLVSRDSEQIQALYSCTGMDIPRENGLGELRREDFNFDGYPDLLMRSAFDQQTGNSIYCIWLYDPKAQRFVLSEELSKLTNPQAYPNTKTVVSRKKGICMGHCFDEIGYTWADGHLKPVREESENEDPALPPTEDCRYVHSLKRKRMATWRRPCGNPWTREGSSVSRTGSERRRREESWVFYYFPVNSRLTMSLTCLPSTREPAAAKRAMAFFITEPMSFMVGEPISAMAARTVLTISSSPAARGM